MPGSGSVKHPSSKIYFVGIGLSPDQTDPAWPQGVCDGGDSLLLTLGDSFPGLAGLSPIVRAAVSLFSAAAPILF